MPHLYPSQEGNDFLRAASAFAKATADLPSNSQDVKDERRSRESFNIKNPLLGGVGVGMYPGMFHHPSIWERVYLIHISKNGYNSMRESMRPISTTLPGF